jgi:hypothetical protein
MIGDAALGKIVCADAFGAVASASLGVMCLQLNPQYFKEGM